MRNRLIITGSVATVLLVSCGNTTTTTEPQSLMETSKQELADALAERDQLLVLVRDISTGMEQIRQLENLMAAPGSKEQRSAILADIAAVKNTLRERRRQLADLESRLRESTLFTDELDSTIQALRRQIDRQSLEIDEFRRQLTDAKEQIDSLNSEVDSLSTTVVTVNRELGAARENSTNLTNELNTCYFVIASKEELKEHHILETGFLRKTKLLHGDFDRQFFTTGDKRTIKQIPLYTGKAKVLTNHPAGSYTIADMDGQKILTVTDADNFWSLSNYLVIQVD